MKKINFLLLLNVLMLPLQLCGQNTFPATGNVGIGTSYPLAKLHINNGDNSYGAILANANESGFSLYTKTLTTQAANSESFRMGMKYTSNENNGFISFYRGTGGDGGFLGFSTNGEEKMRITQLGNVGIGISNPSERLVVLENIALSAVNYQANNRIDKKWIFSTRGDGTAMFLAPRKSDDSNWDWPKQTVFKNGNIAVYGKLEAIEVKVTQSPSADFVFEEDYNLPKLEDVEKHIKENKHLPEIASAKEMEREGVNIGEFQIKLLQKIEELTLYSIEQNKKIKALESENQQFKTLLERVEKLEKNTK